MCLAVPMKVLAVTDDFCTVEMNGVRKHCYAGFLDRPPVEGDHLLVHAGMAIRILEPRETEEILRELKLLIDGELNA